MRALCLAASALALAALVGGSANAVTLSSTFGPYVAPASSDFSFEFDGSDPAGATITGDYQITSGTSGIAAAPAGDTTNYLSVPKNNSSGTATFWLLPALGGAQVSALSFYWGSIDAYNTLDVLDSAGNVLGSFGGSLMPPSNGDQFMPSTNRNVLLTFGVDEHFGGLRLTSTQYAFEIDHVNLSAAVPEPATWAMMILGFGGIGALARRRASIAFA